MLEPEARKPKVAVNVEGIMDQKTKKEKMGGFSNCWIQGTSAYNFSHSSPVHEIPTEVISLLISSE